MKKDYPYIADVFRANLPKEIADKAIANLESENQRLDIMCDTVGKVLRRAFFWDKTPEEYEYWLGVYDRFKKTKIYKNELGM